MKVKLKQKVYEFGKSCDVTEIDSLGLRVIYEGVTVDCECNEITLY